MKIVVRTMNSQVKYTFDIETTTTVDNLKDLIEKSYSHPKSQQVLIYSGKILNGEQTLESYNIKENDFLVLMIKKPAVPATPKPATSTATNTTTPASAPAPTPSAPSGPSTAPVPSSEPTSPINLMAQSASTLVSGSELQAMIDNIAGMGFPKEQVAVALRASFGNPDRALDYLLNGIPPNLVAPATASRPVRTAPPSSGAPSSGAPSSGAPSSGAPSGSQPAPRTSGGSGIFTGGVELPVNLLPPQLLRNYATPGSPGGGVSPNTLVDYLRRHPAFPQLLQVAQSNPERFEEIMQQVLQSHPELLNLLQSRELHDLFGAGAGGGGTGAPASPGPSGGIQLQVTPQDQEAITRLMNLGFSRESVLQAYFTFEKDEELAANFLASYGNDDMEDDEEGDFDE